MESRRHLNQCLQKALLWLLQCQPDALPLLVSQEEFCPPVAGKALRKRSRFPVKRHAFSICDFAAFNFVRWFRHHRLLMRQFFRFSREATSWLGERREYFVWELSAERGFGF
jgi:hypothetical protein